VFKASVLYEANYNATEDIIVNQGGSSSGKTYSILQVLFTKAVQYYNVITVVGESIPNLKAGALRDALDIYNSSPILKSLISDYNRTDRIFQFVNGSIMEFKSYETPQGAKSGKRDYLFINEAQGISKEVFNELHIRTKKQTYIDYNPNAEFWVHEDIIGKPDSKLFISDHRHNPFVPQKIRDKIEALRYKDMELFKVYARGLTGKIEGLVFRNFDIVNEVPLGSELIGIGMDWGFTNDPTTVIKVFRYNSEIYIDELLYQTGLTNADIIVKLNNLGVTRFNSIIADSAEPKSIEDLNRAGFNVEGAKKGADSIINSIDTLKQFKINITRNSTNTIKEFRSYKWATDSSGKTINKPVDFNNHTIDAIRYVALNKINKPTNEIVLY
jgi:phage terminase large subunit